MLIKQHPRISELCCVCTLRQKHDNLKLQTEETPFFVFVFNSHYSAWRNCVVDSGLGSWLQELGSCTFPRECHHTFFSATCLICSSDCCLLAGYPGGGSDWHHSPVPTSGIMNSYSVWQAELRSGSQGGAEFKWWKVAGNEDVDVTVEGIQLHNWCYQTKLRNFLGMILVKLVLLLTGTSVALRDTLGLQWPTSPSGSSGVW